MKHESLIKLAEKINIKVDHDPINNKFFIAGKTYTLSWYLRDESPHAIYLISNWKKDHAQLDIGFFPKTLKTIKQYLEV